MSRGLRWTLLAVLLLGIGLAATILREGAVAATHAFQSSADCRPCHADVFAEWDSSHHRIAYTNPEVRKLSDDFQQKECAACHLPRPVAETGLGQRTLPRQSRPLEGVDCLACHLDAQGRIAARRDVPGAPCAPRRDDRQLGVEMCRSCHDQHQTTQQWERSQYAAKGVTCHDCHMPEVARAGGRRGRSHVFAGCHDPEMLGRAGRFAAAIADDTLTVTVENSGAGHNLPTEERHRAVDVMCRWMMPGGTFGEWTQLFRFRQPYRGEPGEDTQLPAHATKTLTAARPEGAVAAEVRVLYRLNPFMADGDAVVLWARTVEVP